MPTQFATDASGASWWPTLQVAQSGDQNVPTMDAYILKANKLAVIYF